MSEEPNLEQEADAMAAKIAADRLRTPGNPWLLRIAYWLSKWCSRKAREWRVDD